MLNYYHINIIVFLNVHRYFSNIFQFQFATFEIKLTLVEIRKIRAHIIFSIFIGLAKTFSLYAIREFLLFILQALVVVTIYQLYSLEFCIKIYKLNGFLLKREIILLKSWESLLLDFISNIHLLCQLPLKNQLQRT